MIPPDLRLPLLSDVRDPSLKERGLMRMDKAIANKRLAFCGGCRCPHGSVRGSVRDAFAMLWRSVFP
jgi:hypothetical protein